MFNEMVPAYVVIDARAEAGHTWHHRVPLGRVQVAAGRVAPKRPARTLEFLPCRKAKRELKENSEGVQIEAARRNRARGVELAVTHGDRICEQGQVDPRRAGKSTKGVRLVGPVEIAGRAGIL